MQLLWEELRLNGVIDVGPQATGFWIPDLFLWYLWDKKAVEIEKSAGGTDAFEGERKEEPFGPELKTHEGAQAMLLELGNLLGYDTYTADPGKDPGEQFYDEVSDEITGKPLAIPRTLGEIATLNEVPGFAIEKILESVRRIDVIWFKEEFPEVCFEVEHTTNVKDGLLKRISDQPPRTCRKILHRLPGGTESQVRERGRDLSVQSNKTTLHFQVLPGASRLL